MSKPILNPGDVICYECKGKKYIITNSRSKYHISNWNSQCKVCYGEGKLDWIENLCGKEPWVYVREIDLSTHIPIYEPSIIVKGINNA